MAISHSEWKTIPTYITSFRCKISHIQHVVCIFLSYLCILPYSVLPTDRWGSAVSISVLDGKNEGWSSLTTTRKLRTMTFGPRTPLHLSPLVINRWCSVTQSCLTLCSPLGYSPRYYPLHGLFQARILEWVAISSSRGSS